MRGSLKNKLKSAIKRLQKKHDFETDNQYENYKMSIIGLVATILLKNDKLFIDELNEKNLSRTYKEELEFVNNYFNLVGIEINYDVLMDEDVILILKSVIHELNEYNNIDDTILAWIYQYFNLHTDFNKLSNTQFFTEEYMTQYLVNTNLANDISNMKIIDPACGGGNFLICILNKQLCLIKDTMTNITIDVIEDIMNSLYGYDLDPYLSIITALSLKILIIKTLGDTFSLSEIKNINTNIYISEQKIEWGSLDRTSECHLLINTEQQTKINMHTLMSENTYDFVFTNPPFHGIKGMSKTLRDYLSINYNDAKGDLCYAFLEQSLSILKENGIIGVVSQASWMYLSSFKNFRKKILINYSITTIIDLGANAFSDLTGEKTNVVLLSIRNAKPTCSTDIKIARLKYHSSEDKKIILSNNKYNKNQLFEIEQNLFTRSENYEIEYLSFGGIKSAIDNFPKYGEFAIPMQGTSTGDNKTFVKYHWNVKGDNWVLVSKGGGYCKWNGLNIYKINWENDGDAIKKHESSAIRNLNYFNETELVYSDTGTAGLNVRLLKNNQIFIASGPGIRDLIGNKYAHISLLNSRLFSYFIRIFTPKLTISAGYIAKLPTNKDLLFSREMIEIGRRCTFLKDEYLKNGIINYEFEHINYSAYEVDTLVETTILNSLNNELERLKLEQRLEKYVMKNYKLSAYEINHIYEEVGYCAMDVNCNNDIEDIKWLDQYYIKSINYACEVNILKDSKNLLGIEGILESLAIKHQYAPEHVYKFIEKNIKEMVLTKEHYLKDTIHKCILYLLGYKNDIDDLKINFEVAHIIKNICDLLKDIDYKYVQKFILAEFNEWHFNAFKNSPIVMYDSNLEKFVLFQKEGEK